MANPTKQKNGKYRLQFYIGRDSVTGKRKYYSITSDSQEFLKIKNCQLIADKSRGVKTIEELQDCNKTLRQWADEYIACKSNILAVTTVNEYYNLLRVYFKNLQQKSPFAITAKEVQAEINEMAKTHSPKTCKNVYCFFSSIINYSGASLKGKIRLPQERKPEMCIPNIKEIQYIYKLVKGTELEIPFLLATRCGLRASEICGLDGNNVCKCINCETGEMHYYIDIKKARVKVGKEEFEKLPKSSCGARKLPIDKEMYDKLKAVAGNKGRVFKYDNHYLSKLWAEFRSENELNPDWSFHSLRHFFASICVAKGVPQFYTSKLMGHSTCDTTQRIYQHVFDEQLDETKQQILDVTHSIFKT